MNTFSNRIYNVFQKEGFIGFFKLAIVRSLLNVVAFPIALGIIAISPWVRIRLIKLYSWRVGHFGMNTHLMLCAIESDEFKEKFKYKNLFYADPRYSICNEQLYDMWKRVIKILPLSGVCFQVDRFLIRFCGEKYNNLLKRTFESSAGGYDQWRFLERYKKSYLNFINSEENKAEMLIRKLGISPGSSYVCLLVRDPRYLQVHMPGTDDWMYHHYRDADINNYKKAIMFLVEKGYYVVRMGKIVAHALDIDHPKVIDYANHKSRSDFMDIYLSVHCKFFISTGAGIDSIPHITGRPLLMTNAILCDMKSYQGWSLCIIRNVINIKEKRLLTLKEIFSEYKSFTDTEVCKGFDRPGMFAAWEKKGLHFIENTPEEIVDVIDEMIKMIDHEWHDSEENKFLQKCFWQCFPAALKDESSIYRDIKTRVGESFLKKYQSLIVE